jgi:Pilus formation protein N terminal region
MRGMSGRSAGISFAIAALYMAAGAADAAGVSVGIDMSTPVHLSRDAASVVIGNPSIADVYVQNGRLVFLQGRSFGTTNLIALDSQGQEILDVPVTVTSSRGRMVTLQRGVDGRISYACAGRCEPEVMPGDDPDHVKSLMDAVSGKTGEADQVATSGGRGGGAPN